MKLTFKISKEILFITCLLKTPNYKVKGWIGLQNKLWKKYKKGYQLIQGNYYELLLKPDYKKALKEANSDIAQLLHEGLTTKEFFSIYKNARDYKIWLENQWNKNKEIINKELKSILKTELPEKNSVVYVLGNKVREGSNYHGSIFWGHKEDWKNYSLVYLVHEYLHNFFIKTDLEHAVVELVADNEMRIRLNNRENYFECNGMQVGHAHLQTCGRKILKEWKIYLKSDKENIYQFIRRMKKKYPEYSQASSEKY